MYWPKVKVSTVILLVVFLVGLADFCVGRSQHQETAPKKLSPAERQKIHAALFSGWGHTKKLRDIDPGKDIRIVSVKAERFLSCCSVPPKPACVADAIVIGVVKDHTPFLTEDGRYVITDYSVSVQEVLKDNPAAQINFGDSIIVTRPGGTLILDSRKVEMISEDYPVFRLARSYLLFLKSVPQTGAYQGLSPDDVSLENPDQRALDEARRDLGSCNGGAGG